MKLNLYGILIFTVLLCCFVVSCDDESKGLPTGYLYLNVDEDHTLLTKAQMEMTNESLHVDIIKSSGDTLKSYNDYLREVKGEKLILPVGKYAVSVSSNHTGEAIWDTPFYQGCDTVEVTAGVITSAKVVCKIANTKVSVKYNSSVQNNFLNYEATISNSSGSLTYIQSEHRSGFFTPEKLNIDLKLINHAGNEFHLRRVYPDVEPQYHYTFRFSTTTGEDETDDAGADFGITVDKANKEIICNIFIKEEEELEKHLPKISLSGFSADNNEIEYKDEQEGLPQSDLKLKVPYGIQSLQVKTDSYQFESLPEFSLKNWDEAVNLGFPDIDETKEEQTLDLQDFIMTVLKPNGTKTVKHTFTMTVLDKLNQESSITFTIVRKANVSVGLEEPIVWAKFAVLKGTAADLDDVSFMIRKKDDGDYIPVKDVVKDLETSTFSALIIGLEANTVYEYYAIAGGNESEPEELPVTDDMPTVPNLNFDAWCTKDGYPFPNESASNGFWDSGNQGAKTAGKKPTEETTEFVVKGSAVYLHSEFAAIAFAAGNIYTGSFVETKYNPLNPGAILSFGQKYTGRPTSLSGYYCYQPVAVDKGGYGELTKDKMDKCSIYIALFDWTAPYSVDTQKKDFVDLSRNNKSLIGYGALSDDEASKESMKAYERFTIDIEYYDMRKPTYVLIVASASKYGDYFTGGEGSTLYIDEFSLGFDYNPASFVNTSLKNLNPTDITKQ